jgi:MFS family permease
VEQLRTCYKCSYETHEVVKQCPQCGQRLRTAREVRVLGWIQLLLGLFLVGMMGTISFYVAPILLQAGLPGGDRFTGTPQQALMILGLFSLVIMFGLTSIVSGLWQIKTGRRNKWIFIFMMGLVIVLLVVCLLIRVMLGGNAH